MSKAKWFVLILLVSFAVFAYNAFARAQACTPDDFLRDMVLTGNPGAEVIATLEGEAAKRFIDNRNQSPPPSSDVGDIVYVIYKEGLSRVFVIIGNKGCATVAGELPIEIYREWRDGKGT